MDCTVCCEPFNKRTRCLIECLFCNYKSCASCVKTYLLDSFHNPHCMNCRKEWSSSFLIKLSSFMRNEYRAKRELLLVEREKSFIPSMLSIAERERKNNFINVYINLVQDELYKLYQNGYTEKTLGSFRTEKKELKRTIRALYEQRSKLCFSTEEKKTFIMKCTISSCKGFLSTRYKCGLCGHSICPDCHVPLEKDHTCNSDTIATIKELKKTTKPCPSCQCPIYKIEGCDQMWCIQCHTAFSWRTGQVESGIIHNPHYLEYIKEKGHVPRNPNDIVCGGLPDYQILYQMIMSKQYGIDEISYIRNMYQSFVHLREYVIYQLPNNQEQVDNRSLLLQYILEQITEEQFKATLYVREQKRNRGLEERQILDAYLTIGEEAFRKLIVNALDIYEFINELEEIKVYSRIELDKMNINYQHKGYIHSNIII